MSSAAPQNPPQAHGPHPGPEHVQHVFQLATGILTVAAFRATLECRIPDKLAAGSKPVSELAREADVNEGALYRCLRAIATTGVFSEVSPRVFANTLASEVLRSDHPSKALDTALWLTNPFHLRSYAEFMHSVKTGETCVEKAVGVPCFDYFPTDPKCSEEFNNAMTSFSTMVVPSVLESYDFTGIGTLCDVAGGHGMLLSGILKKYPAMHGILFDLEHVVAGSHDLLRAAGVADRCETASGDFFQSVPSADAYIMKHIIHDWEESKAITILRNCAKAMRGDGKILLVESILPGGDEPHISKWIDVEMLALPGGQERNEAEYRELLEKAGLQLLRVIPNQSPLSVIEAVKK
jgi:hypothetical protein